VRWTAATLALGAAGGLCASAITWTIAVVSRLSGGSGWLTPVVMALAGALSSLHPELPGTGLDVARRGEARNPVAGALKLLLAGVVIGAGGSGGQVGPCVQSCVSLGRWCADRWGLTGLRREWLVAAAASGGVAGVLCAPVAAALFALEALTGRLRYACLPPAVVASVTGYTVYCLILGKRYLLTAHAPYAYSWVDLPKLTVVGLVSAAAARGLVLAVQVVYRWLHRIPRSEARSLLAGLSVAALGLVVPQATGLGLDWASSAAMGRMGPAESLLAFLGKVAATSLTLGSGVPAGFVSPVVCASAFFGSAVREAVGLPAPAAVAASMSAFLAVAFDAPVSAAVLVMELFGIDCAVPAALGAVLGYLSVNPGFLTELLRGSGRVRGGGEDSGREPGGGQGEAPGDGRA